MFADVAVTTHHTHDVGQDGPRGADEGPHDGQQVVVEQEALGAEGPAGVAVEHRDHHRHVGPPDGRGQGHPLGRDGGRGGVITKRGISRAASDPALNHRIIKT